MKKFLKFALLCLAVDAMLLVSCHPHKAAAPSPQAQVDPYPNLPHASKMKTGAEVLPPKQALAFCKRHKDFEQC